MFAVMGFYCTLTLVAVRGRVPGPTAVRTLATAGVTWHAHPTGPTSELTTAAKESQRAVCGNKTEKAAGLISHQRVLTVSSLKCF